MVTITSELLSRHTSKAHVPPPSSLPTDRATGEQTEIGLLSPSKVSLIKGERGCCSKLGLITNSLEEEITFTCTVQQDAYLLV